MFPLLADSATTGYAAALLRTVIALIGVLALAAFCLRLLARMRRGGTSASSLGKMRGRVAIDDKSYVAFVEVGDEIMMLGCHPAAAPVLLKSMPADTFKAHQQQEKAAQ